MEFGEDVFLTDGLVVLCKICGVKIASEKKFILKQLITKEKHVKALRRKETQDKVKTQIFISEKKIAEILVGKETSNDSLSAKRTADYECEHSKYTPITSVDVERIFQLTKMYYPTHDASFYLETLKKTLLFKSIQRIYIKSGTKESSDNKSMHLNVYLCVLNVE